MKSKVLMSLLVLVLALAACGGGGGSNDPASATGEPEEVELVLWLYPGLGFEDLYDDYIADNPHVSIREQFADYDEHHDRVAASLAAGSGGPDIAVLDVSVIGSFLQNPGAFVNVRDHGADDVRDLYLDWRWQQGSTLDGEVTIGLPTDVGGMGMCYRVDLFGDAGLPTDRDEVSALWADSWGSFIDVGQQYTEATGRPFVDSANQTLYRAVVHQSADNYYDADGQPIFEESSQVRKAWDTVTAAIDAGIDANIEIWSSDWNIGMNDGAYAVLTCPAWMMGLVQEQAPDTAGNWDIAALPEGGGNWGGSHLVVPAQSKNHEEAYRLIEWLTAPAQQLAVFEDVGNFPSTPELYDEDAVQDLESEFFNGAPVGRIFAANALVVEAQNIGPHFQLINSEFEAGLGRVASGRETSDEAWESTIANILRETQF
ncbi:ABC transporter substrate-binding protein [Nitriliruptor alkaliphilus]|uniref:ABC transporter substrate-binding protein n=1 Tax=Nitriliruptor alkaliphilus TaxID=427918 RepID=UPI0006985F3B|nr:extracellular solute-binding protein [Nitriliruptor alkaliphilus]